jgi:hypothetical protein
LVKSIAAMSVATRLLLPQLGAVHWSVVAKIWKKSGDDFLKMRFILYIIIVLAVLLFAPAAVAYAHSPLFPGENHGPESAYEVDDPAKSWAIYTSLESDGIADYYKFTLSEGDKIQLMLILPESPSISGVLPSFALLGPGLTQNDAVPPYVEVPPDYGIMVVNGVDPGQAVFEPFTPGWFYEVASLTVPAPEDGTYYVAVYDPAGHHDDDEHGHAHEAVSYSLIVGYVEAFTPLELIMIPYSVHEIYVWEGQSQFIVYLPVFLVIVIGGLIVYWRSKRGSDPRNVSKWLAAFGGLAFLGSAVGTIYQVLLAFTHTGGSAEAAITMILVVISVVLAVFTLLYALRSRPVLTSWRRVGLIITGIIALFAWSGFYLGPALVFAAALVPPYSGKKLGAEEIIR